MQTLESISRQSYNDLYRFIICYDRSQRKYSLSKYVLYLQSIGIDHISRSYLYKVETGEIAISDSTILHIIQHIKSIDNTQCKCYQISFYKLIDLALRQNIHDLKTHLAELPDFVHYHEFDYYCASHALKNFYIHNETSSLITLINLLDTVELYDPYISIALKVLTYSHFYYQKSTRLVPLPLHPIDADCISLTSKINSIRYAVAVVNNCFNALLCYGSNPHLQQSIFKDQIDRLLSSGYLLTCISVKIMQCYAELWSFRYKPAILTILNIKEMAEELGFKQVISYCDDFLINANLLSENFETAWSEIKKQNYNSLINSKRLIYLMLVYICEPNKWNDINSQLLITNSRDPLNLNITKFFKALADRKSSKEILLCYFNIIQEIPDYLWMELNLKFLVFMKQYALMNKYTSWLIPLSEAKIDLLQMENKSLYFIRPLLNL